MWTHGRASDRSFHEHRKDPRPRGGRRRVAGVRCVDQPRHGRRSGKSRESRHRVGRGGEQFRHRARGDDQHSVRRVSQCCGSGGDQSQRRLQRADGHRCQRRHHVQRGRERGSEVCGQGRRESERRGLCEHASRVHHLVLGCPLRELARQWPAGRCGIDGRRHLHPRQPDLGRDSASKSWDRAAGGPAEPRRMVQGGVLRRRQVSDPAGHQHDHRPDGFVRGQLRRRRHPDLGADRGGGVWKQHDAVWHL